VPGIPGNYFTLSAGKQTVKGTPAATTPFKTRATGGFVRPERNIIELEETDSSRQARPTVVVGSRSGGAISHYLRSDEYGLWALAAMGASTPTGAGPYTHLATMTDAGPYITLIEAYQGTALVNKYVDCRIIKQTIRGAVGGIFTVENTWAGLSTVMGATDSVAVASAVTPLTWPKVTVTKNAVTTDVISEVELDIDNGGEYIEGDVGMEPIDYVWGRWLVTGQITVLFENDQMFRQFHGGSSVATTLTETIYADALTVTISRGAGDEVSWIMSGVEYQTYEISPDPSGSPIRVAMAFRAKAQTSPANTLSVSTKNSTPTY